MGSALKGPLLATTRDQGPVLTGPNSPCLPRSPPLPAWADRTSPSGSKTAAPPLQENPPTFETLTRRHAIPRYFVERLRPPGYTSLRPVLRKLARTEV